MRGADARRLFITYVAAEESQDAKTVFFTQPQIDGQIATMRRHIVEDTI